MSDPSRQLGPSDQAAIRRVNLARVLEEVRRGPQSRASIAVATGLTKATVSSVVSDLLDRGLVRDAGRQADGALGRPGRLVELDGTSVGVLGLEANADFLIAYGTDLSGRVLVDQRITFDTMHSSVDEAVVQLGRLGREAVGRFADTELAGVAIAVPALVDAARGTVLYAPNLPWRNIALADLLRGELSLPDTVPITVDNDANAAALAEYRYGSEAGTSHMVCVSGAIGVGGGLIVDGKLLRGADGFSGEIGHIPVDPLGEKCGCGRIGCLETKIGLSALMRAVEPGLSVTGPIRDPGERVAELLRRAQSGEPRVLSALAEVGTWLGIGASILVNLVNPQVIVLGGYFAAVAPYMVPTAMSELRARCVGGDAATCRITASVLGFGAAVRGGAGAALEAVFADPSRIAVPDVIDAREEIL